jgi:HSF-type DNA-binding
MGVSTLRTHGPVEPVSVDGLALAELPKAVKSSSCFSPKRKHEHIIVQHNYHDHACDSSSTGKPIEESSARGGVTTPFPIQLHEMLDRVEQDGFANVISWQPHGRCFVVHKPDEFKAILHTYFKLSKIASFQRQLNLYGFQRLTRGIDKGGYYHELFLRNKTLLSHEIQRVKVKGTGVRARSNPDQEPDFWTMTWVDSAQVVSSSASIVSYEDESDADNNNSSSMEPIPLDAPLSMLLPAAEDQQEPLDPTDDDDMACDILLKGWGKPFHAIYGDIYGEPDVFVAASNSPVSTSVDLSWMVEVPHQLDFDEMMNDVVQDNDFAFVELLERCVDE